MVLKKFAAVWFCLFLIMLLVSCGSDYQINGEGEIIELKPSEVQDFVKEKSGFLYIKSALKADSEDDKKIMKQIKHIAKEKEIYFYIFDQQEYKKWIKDDLDIALPSQSISFYKNGKKKAVTELSDVEKTGVIAKAIPSFVEKVINNYVE